MPSKEPGDLSSVVFDVTSRVVPPKMVLCRCCREDGVEEDFASFRIEDDPNGDGGRSEQRCLKQARRIRSRRKKETVVEDVLGVEGD
jgi:hypothetical protein